MDHINTLFDKQSSKYVSKKVVNLYLNDKSHDELSTEKPTGQLDDLTVFSDFLINQRYQGGNVLYLPLHLNEEKGSHLVPESHT